MTVIQAIHVDIAIVDLDLPGMTGVEFIVWAKEQERFVDLPIIVVTSAGDTSMQLSFEACDRVGLGDRRWHAVDLAG